MLTVASFIVTLLTFALTMLGMRRMARVATRIVRSVRTRYSAGGARAAVGSTGQPRRSTAHAEPPAHAESAGHAEPAANDEPLAERRGLLPCRTKPEDAAFYV
eukprot:jgi/Ulvmu1/6514/UM003_0147.1